MKVLLISLSIIIMANTTLGEDAVCFSDAKLKAVIEEKLGVSNPNATDMLALTIILPKNWAHN